jgi:hypothetical protein
MIKNVSRETFLEWNDRKIVGVTVLSDPLTGGQMRI